MLIVIISIIIFLGIIIWNIGRYGYCEGDTVIGLFFMVILSVLSALFIGISLPETSRDEVNEIKKLYAMNDESGTGTLYYADINDGSIGCMIEGDIKGKKQLTLTAERTSIVEGNYDEPYIEIYKTKFKENWYWLFGIHINFFSSLDRYYILYIPEGSCRNN